MEQSYKISSRDLAQLLPSCFLSPLNLWAGEQGFAQTKYTPQSPGSVTEWGGEFGDRTQMSSEVVGLLAWISWWEWLMSAP